MKRVATVAALALSAMWITAGPLRAEEATVTRGTFGAFALALTDPALNAAYGDLAGHAQMVRMDDGTPDGKTIVSVHVTGLNPDVAYGSHVHKQACADGDADGHYRFDPAGAPTPPNEIWPAFTTNDDGIGNGRAVAAGRAGPAAISVVVHAPGGAKIGCADLA